MVDSIQSAVNRVANTGSSSGNTNSNSDSTKIQSDYNKFLLLMTKQMQNQDPLKPMESTEFLSQLAQFSGVEQQVKMNTKLDNLVTALGGTNLMQASGFLNKTVGIRNNFITYNGTGSTSFDYTTSEGATTAKALIEDAGGNTIRTLDVPMPSKGTSVTWDGKNDNGTMVGKGNYQINIIAYDNNNKIVEQQQPIVATSIQEIFLDNGIAKAKTEQGKIIKQEDILKIISDN